ncbi:hypothetical protein DFJ73DRAFT_808688 [Zopfochytrium polystomum]|nr:hypothetical protein DFJ73DRAFT_808688 [Zopfochytrium polystomum]
MSTFLTHARLPLRLPFVLFLFSGGAAGAGPFALDGGRVVPNSAGGHDRHNNSGATGKEAAAATATRPLPAPVAKPVSDDQLRALFLIYGQIAIPALHMAETPRAIWQIVAQPARHATSRRDDRTYSHPDSAAPALAGFHTLYKVKDSRYDNPLTVILEVLFCSCSEAAAKTVCRHLLACMLRASFAASGSLPPIERQTMDTADFAALVARGL